MNSRYKDKLVGVYAPGNYGHTSVLDQTQEFARWFWANRKDMELISIKLGIDIKKLNRILTLEQLPDEELLTRMVELCDTKQSCITTICQTVSVSLTTRMTLSTSCTAYEVLNIVILRCIRWSWSNAVDSTSSTHNG